MPTPRPDDRGDALAARQSLLASIVENSHDAILGKTLDGTLTAWNRAAERLFGYSADDVLGQNVRVLIPPEQWPEEDAILDALTRGETIKNYEAKRLTRDGRLLDIALTISPIRGDGGPVIGASTIARDVTRQKAAGEAIRASEARFRQLADTLPEIVWEADASGRTIYYNHRWYELTGMTRQQVRDGDQTAWYGVVHAEDLNELVRRWNRSVVSGTPLSSEARLQDVASGAFRWHLIRATPLAGGDGRTERWIGTASDIEDLRHAEAERLRMEKRAVEQQVTVAHLERVRSVGQMATGLAHELNQPLGAIMNYGAVLKVLLAGDAPAAPGVEPFGIVGDIMDQANRAGEIIRRLRAFVKYQRPQTRLEAPGRVIRDAVALMEYDLRQAGVTVRLDLPDVLPDVDVDTVQIQQVLVNLMRNAIEAMARTPAADRTLSVSAAAEDDAVVVDVADRGTGVAPENAGRIFGSFFTTKPNGLGIGLALCRTMLEEHGGTIWADNRTGGGSVFSFRLPPARADGRAGMTGR